MKKQKTDGAITMKHIAEEAGVSLGTVSHVMSGKAPVRPGLRRRVMEAVRSLGYQPSLIARDLRRNKTSIIGMVIPDITNPFFPAVVRGVEDIAYQNSFRLILCNTDDDAGKEKSYLQGALFLSHCRSRADSNREQPRSRPRRIAAEATFQ